MKLVNFTIYMLFIAMIFSLVDSLTTDKIEKLENWE